MSEPLGVIGWALVALWLVIGVAGVVFRLWTCPLEEVPFSEYGEKVSPILMLLAVVGGLATATASVLQFSAATIKRARVEKKRVADLTRADLAAAEAELDAMMRGKK